MDQQGFPFMQLATRPALRSLAAIRIAPDTHVAQAVGRYCGRRPGGLAAPEERWYRAASRGFAQSHGCRRAPIPKWLTARAMRNRWSGG